MTTTEHELRTIKRLIYLALAVVLLIGGVFWASVRDTTNDIIEQRDEARRAECRRDNDQSDRAVAYARGQAEVIVAASRAAGRHTDPNIIAAYIDDAGNAARELFPQRSCTAEAIERHYQTPEAQP